MGSLLGFRPPQFSEEVAWRPAWLQQHHVEPFDEQTTPEQKFTNITTGKDVNLSSRDEGRYDSCHLFLSGEDNSPASLAQSSGNEVVHFHLHLSPDGISQHMPSSLLDTSQAGRIASNNVLSVHQTEVSSAGQEEMENQFRMGYYVDVVNLPPLTSQQETSDLVCPQSPAKDKDVTINNEENAGYLKVSDINEAVELSIAASEALIIHDMVKSSPSAKSLAAAAVLEIALRVRQARLEGLEDGFHCPTEDIDEMDFLSDLDESDMADAFDDVGLSVSNLDDLRACASTISQVKDTPSLENHYGCDEGRGAPKVDCDDISVKQRSTDILDMARHEGKYLPIEVLDFDRQKNLIDDPTFGLKTFVVASHNNSVVHLSLTANSDVPATTKAKEGVDFATENMTSFQPQTNLNCPPHAWSNVNNERADNLTIVSSDRFQSRWIGGWMWKKEINVHALAEHDNAKSIPKFLVGETSYLSESADIAPDENSFVQDQDKGSHMASQSSIPKDLHNRDDEGILFSQDIMRSCSLSLVDPLCSVVPCSISSENACSTLAENPNDEVDAGKCLRPASEYSNLNLQRTSCLNPEFVHEERQAVSIINGEGSKCTVRKQLTSLKTYSMVLPQCSAFVERDNIYCNRSFPSEYSSGLLSAKQNVGFKRGSTGLPSLDFIRKCSTAREIEGNYETLVVQNPVTDLMNQKRNNDETAKDVTELQVHMEKARCSPLILSRGKRSRFQASKEFVNDFSREENPEHSAIQKSDSKFPQRKNLKKEQLKCKIACDADVQARKRVRFSDTEIQLPQKKDLRKMQSSHRDCSTTRAGKRLRHSNPKFKSAVQEVKKSQTNCLAQIINRLIFRDIEFLLTGFPRQKEKETEGLIRKHGGIVLADIPSPPNLRGKRSSKLKLQKLPIVLCFRKLETTKFLYGCAVNAYILNVNWLIDSVAAGYALPRDKYMIISNHVGEKCTRIGRPLCCNNHNYIFDGVGIMLHGKHSFCTRLSKVVKHGGGKVFKTLQLLVQNLNAEKISAGVIVAEDESRVSRHLKHCASEGKIPMMPASWIINSLHSGKLLPFMENRHSSSLPRIKILDFPDSMALSEEI
ncbi:hypothetical protein ACSBR1_020923 [Camellia fascicularis]